MNGDLWRFGEYRGGYQFDTQMVKENSLQVYDSAGLPGQILSNTISNYRFFSGHHPVALYSVESRILWPSHLNLHSAIPKTKPCSTRLHACCDYMLTFPSLTSQAPDRHRVFLIFKGGSEQSYIPGFQIITFVCFLDIPDSWSPQRHPQSQR